MFLVVPAYPGCPGSKAVVIVVDCDNVLYTLDCGFQSRSRQPYEAVHTHTITARAGDTKQYNVVLANRQ